jgi:hypothetical protein
VAGMVLIGLGLVTIDSRLFQAGMRRMPQFFHNL